MLIPEAYRKIEKEQGRPLSEMGNVAGVAFTRKALLEALASLKGSQVAVLGGDVLEVVNGKLRYNYDSWSVNRRAEEDLMDYLETTISEAERYVRGYADPDDGRILYSPVISELGLH